MFQIVERIEFDLPEPVIFARLVALVKIDGHIPDLEKMSELERDLGLVNGTHNFLPPLPAGIFKDYQGTNY
jgi:hypothetical protein